MASRLPSLAWLLVGLAVLGCGCGGRTPAEKGSCRLQPKAVVPVTPPQVKTVSIYWYVSGSMQESLGGSKGAVLPKLFEQLDRAWVRSAGLRVDEVRHRSVGQKVAPLSQLKRLPALSDARSDLPRLGFEVGSLVAGDPTQAAVIVSDMRVDTPEGKPGEALCGTIPVPEARGDVPTLFGKCLAAAWEAGVPDNADLRVIALTNKDGQKATRPLFVVIASRDAGFAASLAREVLAGLDGDADGRELVLLSHRPVVPCDVLGSCVYWKRPDVIARHVPEDGSRACSFLVPGSTGAPHRLRCPRQPPTDSATTTVVSAALHAVGSAAPATATLEDASITLSVDPAGLGAGGTSPTVTMKPKWTLAADSRARIAAWLGEPWGADPDYVSVFVTAAQGVGTRLESQPPECDQSWSATYMR